RSQSRIPLLLIVLVGLLALLVGGAGTATYFLYFKEAPAVVSNPQPAPARSLDSVKPSREAAPERDRAIRPSEREVPGETNAAPMNPSARVIVAPASAAVALPAPPSGPGELVARPKDRIALEIPAAAVRSIRFAHANPPVAAILWRSFDGFQ